MTGSMTQEVDEIAYCTECLPLINWRMELCQHTTFVDTDVVSGNKAPVVLRLRSTIVFSQMVS